MCELLGISSKTEINPRISLKSFRTRGERHSDGWGIACYPDETVQIIKEPLESSSSRLSEMIAGYERLRSKIFICHVRNASPGTGVSHRNTHPFCRGLFGKDFVLAHNGTVRNYHWPDFRYFMPSGQTDSERVLCLLMEHIITGRLEMLKEAGNQHNGTGKMVLDEETLEDLWSFFEHINKDGDMPDYDDSSENQSGKNRRTKLNILFSDGEYLICYNSMFNDDRHGNPGLYWLERKPGYCADVKNLSDINYDIDLGIEKGMDQHVVVVATEKLTDETWIPFIPGEMRVYREGHLIFSSHVQSENIITVDEVYEAPRWLLATPQSPYVTGIPESLRNELGVSEGERVVLSNGDKELKVTVYKTDPCLTGSGNSPAGNPSCHACLPETARNFLGLDIIRRRGTPRFRNVYSGIEISKE